MSRRVEQCGLMDLPSEVLLMVLARVPLLDLVKTREVCQRLQQLVDGSGGKRLWGTLSLEGLAVDTHHQRLIERAASCGNREALIKLSMAYLYNQGIPKGIGAGTLDSWNGSRAAELLFQLDGLSPDTRPLSWLLIRPPWSSSVSNKVCTYHKMVDRCLGKHKEKEEEQAISGLFYSLGQTLSFLEADGKESVAGEASQDWFERGASHDCAFSALQVWRCRQKPNLILREEQTLRSLRKIIAMGNNCSSLDAKLELCAAYASGHYGSVGRDGAFAVIRELMAASRPQLMHRIFRIQKDITNTMRYITVDWMVEIAELKSLSPHTLHQAVGLFDSFLLSRQVDRSALQLLGVTAILVASRWSGVTMLTVRESSWLTENTYSYEEVVRMMAELLGAFQGDIQRFTVCDYLDILLALCRASSTVQSMAHYLSEGTLLHPEFTRFSPAHTAAACLLDAQILLKQDYPWPVHMEQATSFTLSSLCSCCLMIYRRCLTKEFAMADHRGMELCAIASRYSHPSYHSVSKQELMSLEELSEQLGVSNDCFSTPKSKPKMKNKLLSFLSDSCYLSSPLCLSGSDSELESEPDYIDVGGDRRCSGASGQSLSSSSFCSLSGSVTTCGSDSRHSSSPSPSLEQRSCPSRPGSPSSVLSHPTPHHLSTSTLHNNHLITSATSLGHIQTLSAPLAPVTTAESGKKPSSPSSKKSSTAALLSHHLIRHPSLSRCNIHCLPGLSEKTDRTHVSCPDFHSCSTDMELGSLSQDESNDMDTSSAEPELKISRAEPSVVLDFNLPPLGEPDICPLQFTQQDRFNTPHEISTDWNTLPRTTPQTDHLGVVEGRNTHKEEHTDQSRSSPMAKKPCAIGRNPLQPLHNTPHSLISRQSGGGKGKQVASSSQWQPQPPQYGL